MQTQTQTSFLNEISDLLVQPNAFRSILILIASLLVAYWISHWLARGIIYAAHRVGRQSDHESDDTRITRLRQTETYLGITVAIVRAVVVLIVGYIAWRMLSPFASNSATSGIAAIGAGTVFVVIAGQTIGILLRDITAGAIMITEGWYHIGDFVKLEPFAEVSGVVERFTLRSTRLRALNGEMIWVNNQSIMAVHVTPKGVRTIAVDIFVRNREVGEQAIRRIIAAIPKGKTMLPRPLHIAEVVEWREDRWRITVVGQTAPGREWIIEKFFVDSVVDLDDGKVGTDKLLALPPMTRHVDQTADRRFRRAIRVAQETKDSDREEDDF